MTLSTLFSPLKIGAVTLQHRVVMAPLTRMRAGQPGNVPTPLNAEYYGQRASTGGLIIAEATQISPAGQGYPGTPGIHSSEQIAGWRAVTSAVHARGGSIILQLWHVGRISHSSLQPGGQLPVAPSAIPAAGTHFTSTGARVPFETPRALETEEISGIVSTYRDAASHALAAGFDGVELHGANGYLIEQFLVSRTNRRTDRYGGSIANRVRLLTDVTAALIEVAGADRVGVRLSPFGTFNDVGDDEPLPLYQHAIGALAELRPAYLHLIEPRVSGTAEGDAVQADAPSATALFRPLWRGVLIAAGEYTAESAQHAIAAGRADAIAFGRSFISNPDLVDRLRAGEPLTPWNRPTFYGGGVEGYTDYPRYQPLAEGVIPGVP